MGIRIEKQKEDYSEWYANVDKILKKDISFSSAFPSKTKESLYAEMHTLLKSGINLKVALEIIVDSKTILINPKVTLNRLCTLVQIPFEENMLKWKMGGRIEDGIWAKYWYDNIHKSVGFKKYKAKKEPLPETLKPLLELCLPHYKNLIKLSSK